MSHWQSFEFNEELLLGHFLSNFSSSLELDLFDCNNATYSRLSQVDIRGRGSGVEVVMPRPREVAAGSSESASPGQKDLSNVVMSLAVS